MKTCRILKDGLVKIERVGVAERFFSRLVGLLGRSGLAASEGLLIRPCSQVHTFGMKFDIDVLFLSKQGEVLYIESGMAPGRISRLVKKAAGVLELKAGAARELGIGTDDRITAEPY